MGGDRSTDPILVTVVTPAFNCASFISDAIRSVQTQTFSKWEYLIVDDASSDGTIEIVEAEAASDHRIKLLRNLSNQGAAVSRNRGIEAAAGRFIAFLDSDDVWLPDKLERQLAFMNERDVILSFTNYERVSERGDKVIGSVTCPASVTCSDLLWSNPIACSTAVYDVNKAGKVLMPLIRKRQDWGLWFLILNKGFVAYNLGEVMVRYRVHKNSMSSNKFSAMLYNWRFFRDVAGLPLLDRVVRMLGFVILSGRKHVLAVIRARLK